MVLVEGTNQKTPGADASGKSTGHESEDVVLQSMSYSFLDGVTASMNQAYHADVVSIASASESIMSAVTTASSSAALTDSHLHLQYAQHSLDGHSMLRMPAHPQFHRVLDPLNCLCRFVSQLIDCQT